MIAGYFYVLSILSVMFTGSIGGMLYRRDVANWFNERPTFRAINKIDVNEDDFTDSRESDLSAGKMTGTWVGFLFLCFLVFSTIFGTLRIIPQVMGMSHSSFAPAGVLMNVAGCGGVAYGIALLGPVRKHLRERRGLVPRSVIVPGILLVAGGVIAFDGSFFILLPL